MNRQALSSAESAGEAPTDAGRSEASRRLMLFLPGHDPTDMEYHYRRFIHQAGLFAKLWSCDVQVSEREDTPGEPLVRWTVSSKGPNWSQETEYGILRWEDIVIELDDRPNHIRLWRGFGALWEFLTNGTGMRYMRASMRYGLFFFFPMVMLVLFALAGVLAGWLVAVIAAPFLPSIIAAILGVVAGIGAFMGLFHQPGRRWRLHQALDDWDVAREYLHGRTPTVEARLDRFADIIVEALRSGTYGEITLVGHSLGATLALGVLDRALSLAPELAAGPAKLNLLTCGSTIPKLGLHPDGDKVRAQAQRVAGMKGVLWVEYQARHDAINFYKFHPVALRAIGFDDHSAGEPVLRDANIKQMLTMEKLERLRWEFMRIHYQFMLANERRSSYDYFMFALGPVSFAELSHRPDGPVGKFAADGSLLA